MGFFSRSKPHVDRTVAAEADLRRTALAAAIDNARKPQPAAPPRRKLPAGYGLAQRMLFASGDVGRLTGDWPTNPVHADWIVSRYQRTLVARSREQAHNNDFMKAYLRLLRLNIVGPHGIMLNSQVQTAAGEADDSARKAVEAWWKRWGQRENCDVSGQLCWRELEAAAIDDAARDGEFFFRIITGADAGPMGFAIQVIDPQRCPVEFDRNDNDNGNFIRQGIEFNRYGRPVAYFFADEASQRNGQGYSSNGRSLVRVPAADVIHGFVREMPGQKRGLPWMATGLFRAKQTSAMEDAAVVNARVGAAKMGVISFESGTGPEYDEDEDYSFDAEAGSFPVLPEGAKLTPFDPLYPTGELVPFVKLMHRAFAAGGGVAYHSLSQDLTDVNFSSIRHGTLDERETHKERQEWLRGQLHDRVFPRALRRSLLAGFVTDAKGKSLPATDVDRYLAAAWQPRRWGWIDPRADVDAEEGSKNNLMASPSSLIREKGKDPREVWKETAADIAAMKEAGIPDEIIALSFGQKPATAPPKEEMKP